MPQLATKSSKIFPDESRRDSTPSSNLNSPTPLTASNAGSFVQASTNPSSAQLVGYATSTNFKSHLTTNSSSNKSGNHSKLTNLARIQQQKYKSWASKILCYWPQQMVLCSLRTPLVCKLFFMLVIPLIAMLTLSGVFIAQSGYSLSKQMQVDKAVEISGILSALSHRTAHERTVSLLYLTTNGTEFVHERQLAIEKTQELVKDVLPEIRDLKSETSSALSLRSIEACEAELSKLEKLRTQVQKQQVKKSTAYKEYTSVIDNCINVIDVSVRALDVSQLSDNILSYKVFLSYVETVSRIESRAMSVMRRNSFEDQQEYNDIVQLIGRRTAMYDTFIDIATPDQRESWRNFINGDPAFIQFSSVLDSLMTSGGNITNYSWRDFFADTTILLQKYGEMETELIGLIREKQNGLSHDATVVLAAVTSAAILVFLFTVCTIFTCSYCVYKPWAMVIKKREDLMDIALDCADAIAKLDMNRPAVIRIARTKDENCTLLELAFKRIITNFNEFSQFLPQTLIAAVQAAAEEQEAEEQPQVVEPSTQQSDVKRTKQSTHQGPTKTPTSATASTVGSTFGSNLTGSASYKNSSRKVLSTQPTTVSGSGSSSDMVQIRMNYGLQFRDVSILVIDIQNMHGILSHCDSNGICSIHADLLTEFSRVIQLCKGVVHSFVGDKMIASWNSINSVIDREILACKAALKCSQILTEKLHPHWKAQRLPPIECSFAVASGGVHCGNIGSNQQKGYVQFAPMMTRVWRMAKLVKSYGVDSSIILDDSTFQRISMKFTARILDVVQFKDIQHTADFGFEKLYTLVAQKEMENDEWLYELDELEKQEEKGANILIEAFDCLIREDTTAATEAVELYRKEADDALEENIETVERLERYLEDSDNSLAFNLV